jgi:hypothetical protein
VTRLDYRDTARKLGRELVEAAWSTLPRDAHGRDWLAGAGRTAFADGILDGWRTCKMIERLRTDEGRTVGEVTRGLGIEAEEGAKLLGDRLAVDSGGLWWFALPF